MFFLSFNGNVMKLGDKIFYSSTTDIYILASSLAEAKEIGLIIRSESLDLKQLWALTADDEVLHKGGIVVYVSHNGKLKPAYTNLVFGSKRGIDSTKSLKVIYNANYR